MGRNLQIQLLPASDASRWNNRSFDIQLLERYPSSLSDLLSGMALTADIGNFSLLGALEPLRRTKGCDAVNLAEIVTRAHWEDRDFQAGLPYHIVCLLARHFAAESFSTPQNLWRTTRNSGVKLSISQCVSPPICVRSFEREL